MVIRALDHVSQAYTAEDGAVLARLLMPELSAQRTVILSFAGVDGVTSSFVNTAFVALLDRFPYEHIKRHLRIVDSTQSINAAIRKRLDFEVSQRDRVFA
ncbi:STAS-like domain-containing protein [Azospirillum tabaci]|uniref:STAS-like domain-containing protein n=1 Tax=Azospirillum tabaci TaxID=2752310 RepID=UPI0016601AFA